MNAPCPVCGRVVPVLTTRNNTYARHIDMSTISECAGGEQPYTES